MGLFGYVGQSGQLSSRLSGYLSEVRRLKKSGIKYGYEFEHNDQLIRKMIEVGLENVIIVILDYCDLNQRRDREQSAMDLFFKPSRR